MSTEYTADEQRLIDTLPNLRPQAGLSVSNVWIIQWLRDGDRQTGKELHSWLESQRPGWSNLVVARSRAEVLGSIARAAHLSAERGLRPILHIEAHGCELGIEGSDGGGGVDIIPWADLRSSLAELNEATGLNLLVFMAACTGFAGIGCLVEHDRAPALALIGAAGPLSDTQILRGAIEFYRRLKAADSSLHEMAESASTEAGEDVHFEPEIYSTLAREAMIDMIMSRAKQGRPVEGGVAQALWDRAMMIDLIPSNRDRFGLDVRGMVRIINTCYAAVRPAGGEGSS